MLEIRLDDLTGGRSGVEEKAPPQKLLDQLL